MTKGSQTSTFVNAITSLTIMFLLWGWAAHTVPAETHTQTHTQTHTHRHTDTHTHTHTVRLHPLKPGTKLPLLFKNKPYPRCDSPRRWWSSRTAGIWAERKRTCDSIGRLRCWTSCLTEGCWQTAAPCAALNTSALSSSPHLGARAAVTDRWMDGWRDGMMDDFWALPR